MEAVIFDLDGTLIDSAPDIHAAVNTVLARENRAALSLAQVISFIGNGLPHLVRLVMAETALPEARHAELSQAVLAAYEAQGHALSTLYPGVTEALHRLTERGHWLAICTNKPEAPARVVLQHFGLTRLFQAVIGGDSLPQRKPDPAPLQHLIAQAGRPAFYVGDSEVDAETALRADVPFLLYPHGYRKTPLSELQHLARFDHHEDLPDLIARYSGG